ncbi:hypothetical protein QBC33DRAFT_518222 [Phialemonium atrogriseum]|uniref:2-oxoacid dehydrogenase acyltransferase catalytic domain-containing protein n=1 Tax=Phialemonium atrogriseum TaxID=1093897 RepID=A0AAJ0BSQ7_9PEZI|nr:uncharacterized protein QBC33DRAFT_518222 [Phialemonium atrogriseum]KAK1763793.1 hypothetical protein QBC33DRAFT_518222 [Phialemonium atrogriseum]
MEEILVNLTVRPNTLERALGEGIVMKQTWCHEPDMGVVLAANMNFETPSIVEIESQIAVLALKARHSRLTMEDLQGGNFSISNPSIFGSMSGTTIRRQQSST